MCLAIPSKIISIDEATNLATVDTMGVKREASLDLMGESVSVGDFVLLHIGYVMSKIDEKSAQESLAIYEKIAQEMQGEAQE